MNICERLIEDIYKLNECEIFLKKFIQDYPRYAIEIINADESSIDRYHKLISILEKDWYKNFPGSNFFLPTESTYLHEDFFLLGSENVTMRKNLRYMPLLMHGHQFIEINYVLNSADSELITEEGRQVLSDGDIILCPPNFVHCFKTTSDNAIILDFFMRATTFDSVFFQLINNDNYLSTVFSNALYNSEGNYILWHCKDDSQIEELVLESFEEWQEKKQYCKQMLEIKIMNIFLLLMRNHDKDAIFSKPPIDNTLPLFQSIHNYMLVHCQDVTLSSMAIHFGYSDRQLIRILKKSSGKGFSELLQDIRMNKSIQLIKTQRLSIPQIASVLGYSSTPYFRKIFTNTFSFTPEEFQKRVVSINNPT